MTISRRLCSIYITLVFDQQNKPQAIEEFKATFVTHFKSLLNKFTLLDKEYCEFEPKF